MKYYKIDSIGEDNEDFCFSDNAPNEIGDYELIAGESLKEEYPKDPWEITVELGEDAPGLLTASFLGNTKSILMMKKEVADEVLKFKTDEIEVLPFTLLNHKNRVHSKEYVFVNPLGTFDCLNMNLSSVNRTRSGKIISFNEYVLDKEKIKDAPDLFRPLEEPSSYFFSDDLVSTIRKNKFTNFVFEELKIV